QLLSINDEVECVVLRVDEEEKKISLGMKQTEEDPWLALPAKYPPATKITGIVRNLTSFGAFVEVEPGIDGLVHISDMSWTRRVQHPSEIVRKGAEVEVVVLNIDPDQKRISLGLKQTEEDPWYDLVQKYVPGTEWSGSVVRLLDKGVVVDLGQEVEGFVPISHLGVEEELEDPAAKFVEGDQLELKVIESDPINRRIVLSVTELSDEIKDRPLRPVASLTESDEDGEKSEQEVEAEATADEAEATTDVTEATEEGDEGAGAETEESGSDGVVDEATSDEVEEIAEEAESESDADESDADESESEESEPKEPEPEESEPEESEPEADESEPEADESESDADESESDADESEPEADESESGEVVEEAADDAEATGEEPDEAEEES
ncbi:MAG: S1 RNA-binding domain-containing protein, partial [Gemmatimonadota bacterium]